MSLRTKVKPFGISIRGLKSSGLFTVLLPASFHLGVLLWVYGGLGLGSRGAGCFAFIDVANKRVKWVLLN